MSVEIAGLPVEDLEITIWQAGTNIRVRVHHLPSGYQATARDDELSVHQVRRKACRILADKLGGAS